MINHPNRSKKSAPIEFCPVFRASHGPHGAGHIEFSFPRVTEDNLTDEAPDGFDGAWCWSAPPVYPCIVITQGSGFRHVPNRMLRGPDDLKAYRAEFFGRKVWRYETFPEGGSLADEREVHARNEANRKANFKRGREAVLGNNDSEG